MKFSDLYYHKNARTAGVKADESSEIESISSEDYIAQASLNGSTYCFEACVDGDNRWRLEFYEQKSRRLMKEEDPKVITGLIKMAEEWITAKEPSSFYVIASLTKESYNVLADSLKKSAKSYVVVDERDEIKEGDDVIREGNPIGRVIFTVKELVEAGFNPEEEVVDVNDNYEQVEDIKLDKSHTTYKKDDKTDTDLGYESLEGEVGYA